MDHRQWIETESRSTAKQNFPNRNHTCASFQLVGSIKMWTLRRKDGKKTSTKEIYRSSFKRSLNRFSNWNWRFNWFRINQFLSNPCHFFFHLLLLSVEFDDCSAVSVGCRILVPIVLNCVLTFKLIAQHQKKKLILLCHSQAPWKFMSSMPPPSWWLSLLHATLTQNSCLSLQKTYEHRLFFLSFMR